MAQERFWNWKDDDSTFRLNWRDLIIAPHGLYSGFDAVLGLGLGLSLEHEVTGKTKVKQDKSLTAPMGLWKSKQGVVITEDSPVSVLISAGSSADDRIDLIVGDHSYIEVAGGSSALYKVIQGVPSATPAAPSLPSPNTQVILGTLYVPKSSNSTAQMSYTKASVPDWAGDATLMHTNKVQESTALKVFNIQKGLAVVTEIDVPTKLIKNDVPSNFYCIDEIGVTYTSPQEVLGFSQDMAGGGHLVTIRTTVDIVLVNSFGSGGKLIVPEGRRIVQAGECFTMLDISNTTEGAGRYWTVVQGGEPQHNKTNKYNRYEIWNKASEEGTVSGGDLRMPITAGSANQGNFFATTFTNKTLSSMQSFADFSKRGQIEEAGGQLIIHFKGDGNILKHAASGVSTKNFTIPTGEDFYVPTEAMCLFLEDTDTWRLLSVWSGDYTVLNLPNLTIDGLADTTILYAATGHILVYDGNLHSWKNVLATNYISALNLKMQNTFEEYGITYNDPGQGLGDLLNNTYYVVTSAANVIIYDFNVGSAHSIVGLPLRQVGAKMTIIYTNGVHAAFVMNSSSLLGLWLRDSRGRQGSIIIKINTIYNFVYCGDYWLMDESYA